MKRYKRSPFQILLCVGVISIFSGVRLCLGQAKPDEYTFLIATGFLCDTGDSSACPAVAKSAQGDSYELSGAGYFEIEGRSVTASGPFTHKSADGAVLETGLWVANELVSFKSYGTSSIPFTREGREVRPMESGSPQRNLMQFGPTGAGIFSAPHAAGGLAVLRVRLLPVLGFAKDATLQINCTLGNAPRERAVEGIRLALDGTDSNFDEEIGGRTLFLHSRFAASPPSQTRANDADPSSAPAKPPQ